MTELPHLSSEVFLSSSPVKDVSSLTEKNGNKTKKIPVLRLEATLKTFLLITEHHIQVSRAGELGRHPL